ncbi:MAG TPA: DUF4386 domain-containing protein [Methanobacteriaceae archaeon]|jgi:hypothetical protein|nr:DUF4386 domain-containing protein [Methanobacteriaceae archaeon]
MKSTKRIAVIVGLLFLVSTLTFMIGSNQIRSFLIDVSQNKSPLFLGVILEIICGVAVVGIGVLMFPILKLFKKRLALGYVIFRIIECTIIIVGGIYLLSLLEFMWKYEMIIFVFTALGGLIFSYLLYLSKLVPRYLSGLGIIGYLMLFLGVVLDMFSIFNINDGAGMLLYLPGGLFELFLPIWLFIKGFNSSAIASVYDRMENNIKK